MSTQVLPKMNLENEVIKLIDKQLNTYKDHSRIISDYHAEKQISESYNGRQLLELLQNADDAGTDEVLIALDLDNKILRIANNGSPFDINGVKSLMLAYNSSKNKREYIGNKGLGFRSVLNWTTEIKIKTRDCNLEFSPQRAKANFEKLVPDALERKKLIENEEELKENELPFGILSIPHLVQNIEQQEWETIIELKYEKGYQENIKEQIKDLKPEILLFLKHTRKIKIQGLGEIDQILERKDHPSLEKDLKNIEVNGVQYNVYTRKEKNLPNKKNKYYSYKIAWQDDLSDQDAPFFTFFPTQVNSHLPFLIHGTFDLDPTRNHFNKSEDNDFILEEIAETLGELSLKHLKKERDSDWKAYRFLSLTGSSENKHLVGFFKKIREQRDELEVYPTVDNSYTRLENIIEYQNEFPEWVISNGFGTFFSNLLKPVDFDKSWSYYPNHYSPEELLNIFKQIAPKMDSIEERVKIVKILSSSEFDNFRSAEGMYLPLLLNSQNKPVLDDRLVFAMEKGSLEEDNLPEGIKMEFISARMLELLKQEFQEEIEMDVESRESKGKNRSLRRIIGKIVNLGSDDINELIRFIVKESESTYGDSENTLWVKGMVRSLFTLYSQKSQTRESILTFDVPLLNRKGQKAFANELFYGKEYKRGKLTEEIFEGVYTEVDYLTGPENWGLVSENIEELENFFSWLGVNRFLQFEEVDKQLFEKDGYLKYVFKHMPEPEPVTIWFYKGEKILSEKIISALNPENLVLLIAKETRLKSRLEKENDTVLSHKYSNRYITIYSNPSFIEYQLVKNSSFDEILIDNEVGFSNSFKAFNFDHPLFKEYDIDADEVKWIIGRLGAIKSIADLERKQFYKLFAQVEPQNSQAFYKRFFDSCTSRPDKDEELGIDFTALKCYARKGGKGKNLVLKSVSEIYYSDNSIVPQKILNDYWILNLPLRKGEQYVRKFFGVKLLKEEVSSMEVMVKETSILSKDFTNYINKLKQYFLCYRLSTVKTVNQEKTEVDAIKKMDIKLLAECAFSFNGKKESNLEENSFLAVGNDYYIKSTRFGNINQLQSEPEFCDSIAEILSIQFKVRDHKNSFRAIFKDGVKETEHLIKKDNLENNLEKARILLGVSNEELMFWKNVFRLNKMELAELQEKTDLQWEIENTLGYILPDNYHLIDFKNLSKNETFNFLKQLINDFQFSLKDLISWEAEGFQEYYKKKLQDDLFSKKSHFKKLAWVDALNNNKQEDFLNWLFEYESLLEKPVVISKLEVVQFLTDWNLKEFIVELIENEIGIHWVELTDEVKIENHYDELFKAAKVTIDELDVKLRSLLYFPGNEEKVKSAISSVIQNIQEEEKKVEKENIIGKLIFDSNTAPTFLKPPKSQTGSKRKGWTYGKKDDRRNNRLGKLAERTSYYSLLEEFGEGNVEWVSGNSDTPERSDEEHYDIRYRRSGEEWFYLEVKAFNGQFFYLSRQEKRFAEEHKDRYEIALVQGEDIYICSGFFTKDICFESNKKFNATPGDYLVSLKINRE